MGGYREARHAEIRRTPRIEWADLRSQIEGEAIILFGSKRIYAKLFRAEVDPDGPMRLNRPVALPPPDLTQAGTASRHIEGIREAILKGWARPDGERSENLRVQTLVAAFRDGLDAGETLDVAIDAAIDAAAVVPLPAPRGQQARELKPGEVPAARPTDLDPMLRSAGDHPATPGDEGLAVTAPVTDADKQRGLARIEELAGSSAPNARIAAKEALAARDMTGMDDDVRPPPALAPDALRAVLDELIRELEGVGA